MSVKQEISIFKSAFAAGLQARNCPNRKACQAKLWPQLLSVVVLALVATAILLLPFDGALSRAATGAQSQPVQDLRKMTDLVLATPYIVFFSVVMMLCVAARCHYGYRQTAGQPKLTHAQIYQRLGFIVGHCLFGIAAILAAGCMVNILKFVVGRARPVLFDVVGAYSFKPFSHNYEYVSFPSGHACTAAVLATLVALWFPRYRIFAYGLLLAIAFIRVAVEAHYPSDVLMGFTLGMVTTLIIARFLAQAGLLFSVEGGRLFPVRQ